MRLEGKVSLITGAGGGIGRATALRLAEEGSDVALADINPALHGGDSRRSSGTRPAGGSRR